MAEKTLVKIIEKAIRKEEQACVFYIDLCTYVTDATAIETLKWIAAEEQKHKAFLVQYRQDGYDPAALQQREVTYYQIAEYQKEPDITPEMKPEAVFLVAAHREAVSHQFYTHLARLHPQGQTQDMLLKMANEELKHKEKMEYLYANTAFPQTAGG